MSPWRRPTGTARFCDCSAITTCPTLTPAVCIAVGSTSTVISRSTAPATVTSATSLMPRSALVIPGSAICVSCAPVRWSDVSASVTIGKSFGSNRLRIGSSISSGSSLRISEILSRISCSASAGSFPNSNSAMITPKLSSDCESIFLSPLMLEMPSSIGSIRSRST